MIEDSGINGLEKACVKYRHEMFGERNAVEGFFQGLKIGQRGFEVDFRSEVLLFSTSWLRNFMAFLIYYWRVKLKQPL